MFEIIVAVVILVTTTAGFIIGREIGMRVKSNWLGLLLLQIFPLLALIVGFSMVGMFHVPESDITSNGNLIYGMLAAAGAILGALILEVAGGIGWGFGHSIRIRDDKARETK